MTCPSCSDLIGPGEWVHSGEKAGVHSWGCYPMSQMPLSLIQPPDNSTIETKFQSLSPPASTTCFSSEQISYPLYSTIVLLMGEHPSHQESRKVYLRGQTTSPVPGYMFFLPLSTVQTELWASRLRRALRSSQVHGPEWPDMAQSPHSMSSLQPLDIMTKCHSWGEFCLLPTTLTEGLTVALLGSSSDQ